MNANNKVYWIKSGEGECGTCSRKVATERGIFCILSRERCGGDRWARAFGDIFNTEHGKAGYDVETGEIGFVGC